MKNGTRDVVALPRVQAERSADRMLWHQDIQRAIFSTQGRVERVRFADEGHWAVDRRGGGGHAHVVANVGIGLNSAFGPFEDEVLYMPEISALVEITVKLVPK